MKNLGIATVKVEYSSHPAGIFEDPPAIYGFDAKALDWENIRKCPNLPPIYVEQIHAADNTFAACFPEKRKFYVNNYLASSSGTTTTTTTGTSSGPSIIWTPINSMESGSIIETIVGGTATAIVGSTTSSTTTSGGGGAVTPIVPTPPPAASLSSTTLIPAADFVMPGSYESVVNYIGPIWRDSIIPAEAQPDDNKDLATWITYLNSLTSPTAALGTPIFPTTTTTTSTAGTSPPTWHYVNQAQTREGLFWGIESNDFLKENQPFWVNIKKTQTPPNAKNESFILLSIGPGDSSDWYDLYLVNNRKAVLIDYRSTGTPGTSYFMQSFDDDFSKIMGQDKDIEIGVMTCAGRLVIFINKVALVYTRYWRSPGYPSGVGSIREAKLPKGKLKIYGANIQVNINACMMTFAKMGVMGLLVPSYSNPTTGLTSSSYHGIKNNGTFTGSVAKLPKDPSVPAATSSDIYGVDCNEFKGPGSTSAVNPVGFGFHKEGKIFMVDGGSLGSTSLPDVKGFVVIMVPEDGLFGGTVAPPVGFSPPVTSGGYPIPQGKCPYFFEVRGGEKFDGTETSTYTVLDDILQVSESASAPDYNHIKKSAKIVLYNKGATYDFFKDEQYAIRIHWAWNDTTGTSYTHTFSGLTINVVSSEVPGKETLTLECQDYMYVLENVPITNSPVYDGMISHYVIKDLAFRASIKDVVDDWTTPNDYFMPSGMTINEPAVRWPGTNMILECMLEVLRRAEATIYFDAAGKLHVKEVPGGIMADAAAGGTPLCDFVRDPAAADPTKIILDEKNWTTSFDDTVSSVHMASVDRESLNLIWLHQDASPSLVKFYKPLYYWQPALGDYATTSHYMSRVIKYAFKRVKTIAFKTVGGNSSLLPLSFITVDGDNYRIMSINREYNADDNSFSTDYNCQFLGS